MSSSRRVTGNLPAYPCPLQATGNQGRGGPGAETWSLSFCEPHPHPHPATLYFCDPGHRTHSPSPSPSSLTEQRRGEEGVGKLRPLAQLPRRPGVHSENSRPPPRGGPQGLEPPQVLPAPHLAPRLVGAVTTRRPQLGRWFVGWVAVLSVPRAPPKPRNPQHGAPRLAGGRGPGPGHPEESPRGEGAPPGDASASASRRRAIGRGGGPNLRGRGEGPAGRGRTPGARPALPFVSVPAAPRAPRRPPPPSSGETKAAPPEDPGFPAPSSICLDGPRARAPQPLGARRRRIPGPRPARAYLRVPARRSESARRRAAPPPPAPRSGPPTGRAPPSRPDPLGPNASAAGPPCCGGRGRGAGLTEARAVRDAPPSCPHPAWPAVNAARRAYRLRRTQDGASLPKGTARPALRSGFSRLPGRPPGPPASPQATRGRSGLP